MPPGINSSSFVSSLGPRFAEGASVKRHMALILSAIVWLICSGQAHATVNEWSTAGPANIHAIAVDPWDPDNGLAVTETGEVFRSTDAGGRWVPVVIPPTASG